MHVPLLTADLLAGWLLIVLFCTGLGAYAHPEKSSVLPIGKRAS